LKKENIFFGNLRAQSDKTGKRTVIVENFKLLLGEGNWRGLKSLQSF
jgi:hypothetical protein